MIIKKHLFMTIIFHLAISILFLESTYSLNNKQELISDRTRYSKTFDNGDGSRTIEIDATPLHYKDSEGNWQKVADFHMRNFANNSNLAVENNGIFPKDASSPWCFNEGEEWVELQPLNVEPVGGQANANSVTYIGAWPQTDLRYTAEEERVKEEIILHNINAPRRFVFVIKGGGVSVKIELDGSIGIYSKKTRDKLWSLPQSIAYDSKKSQEVNFIPLEQNLHDNGEHYLLEIIVPESWFFAPERVFPIVIDPTIVKELNAYGAFTFIPPFPQTIEYSWYLKGAPGWPRYNASVFQIRYDGSSGPIIASDYEWDGPRQGSGSFFTEGNRTIYANVSRGDAQEWFHLAYGVARLTITYNTGTPPVATAQFPLASDRFVGSDIVLKWNYQDQEGQAQDSFKIQLSPEPSFSVKYREYQGSMSVEVGEICSFSIPELIQDGAWYWRVQASDETTNLWSNWSNSGYFMIDSSPPVAIPVRAISKRRSLEKVQIGWPATEDSLSGVKHYEIEMNEDGEWNLLGQLEHVDGVLNYEVEVTNLAPNQLLWFRLRVVDRAGNLSAWTEFSCATLAVGTNLNVNITGNLNEGYRGTIVLVPVAASGYQIKRTNLATGQVKESPWLDTTTYLDYGLEPHTTYQYQVKTRNIEGLPTEYGSIFTATVPNNRPNSPELLLPVNGSVLNQRRINLQVQPAHDPDGDAVLYCFEVTATLNEGEPDFSEQVLVFSSAWTTELSIQTPNLPDGPYYWRVRAKDDLPQDSLEAEIVNDLYFRIFTKGLAGTFAISEGTAIAESMITLTGISVDSIGGVSPVKLRFRNEDPKNGIFDDWVEFLYGVQSITWELPEGDGAKVISMQVFDNAGNWGGSYQQTILLDTKPPIVSQLFQTNGGIGSVEIMWAPAIDETTKLGSYDLQFLKSGDNQQWQPLIANSESLNAKLTSLTDNEEVQFRLRARDIVGNTSEWSTIFQGCSLPGESSIVRTTTGKDAQGHFLDFELVPVLSDAYRIELIMDGGGGTSSDWLTSPASLGEASTGNIYRDYGLYPHGTYSYRVNTRNASGEETKGQEQFITLVNLPPSIPTLISPLGWVASFQVELRHTFSEDDDSDLLTYIYTVQDEFGNELYKGANPTVTGLEDSLTYNWFVQVSDGVDVVQSEQGTFTVDLTAPTISFSDIDSAWVENRTVSISAIDSTSGLAELSYRWDDNPYMLLDNGTTVNVPHGIHTLWVRAIDKAGYVQEKSTLYRVDSTAPVVRELEVQGKLLTPFSGGPQVRLGSSDSSGIFASWYALDPESGLRSFRVGVFEATQEPKSDRCFISSTLNPEGSYFHFVSSSLEDGKIYLVAVQAENQVGTWSDFVTSEPIFIDGSPPELMINEISGGVKYQNTIYLLDFNDLELSFSAHDPHSGIVEVAYAIVQEPKLTGKENWKATVEQLAFEVKVGVPFHIAIRATNAVGLNKIIFTSTIVLDNTAPLIINFSDEGEFSPSTRRLVFNATVAEPESVIEKLQYCLGTAPGSKDLSLKLPMAVDGWLEAEVPSGGFATELVVDGVDLSAGTYFATVKVTNVLGLSSQLSTDGIIVDLNRPAIPVVIDDGSYSPDNKSYHAWWYLSKEPSGDLQAYAYRLYDDEAKEVFSWRSIRAEEAQLPVEIHETALALSDGRKYFLEVKAIYQDGSESPFGISDGIIIDSKPPQILSIKHARYLSSQQLEFTWESEESISGIRKASYAIGTTRGGADVTDGFISFDPSRKRVVCSELSLLEGNIYYATIILLNGAGLQSHFSSDGFGVDFSPPPAPKVVDSGLYTNDNTQLSANWLWTDPDPESGTVSYAYGLLKRREVDTATVWHDLGLGTEVTVDNLALEDGSVWYFAVRATNGAGLISIGYSDGIIVDTSAPNLPRIDDFGNYLTVLPATLRALIEGFDYESGIESYEYCFGTEEEPEKIVQSTLIETNSESVLIELPDLFLVDGTRYFFTVKARNNAGIVSTSAISDGVMVDLGFPKIISISDEGDFTSKNNELACSWTATPSASNIVAQQYAIVDDPNQVDGIRWVDNGLQNFVVAKDLLLEDGETYYFLVRVQNAAGTWTPTSQLGRSDGIVVDASPPPRPQIFVESQYTAGSIFFTWSGEDPHSGIETWQYAIGTTRGGTELTAGWVTIAESNKRAIGLINLPVAHGSSYFITVRSQNRAGAWSDLGYSKLIVGDCTPPSTPIVDIPGTYLTNKKQIIGLKWQSEDPQSGIAAWRYALTQGITEEPCFCEPILVQVTEMIWNLDNLNLVEGETYYLAVETQNSLGNWSETGWSQPMIVDTIPPKIITEEKEFVTNTETFAIPWEINEAGQVVVTYQRPDGSKLTETYSVDLGKHFYEAVCPAPGLYILSFVASDLAGNSEEEVVINLRKNAPPQVTPIFDRQVRKGEPFSLTASAHDPDGEIVSYFWDLGNDVQKEGQKLDGFAYPELGIYPVVLTVTDNDGASSSHSFEVTVTNTSAGSLYLSETWSGNHEISGDVLVPKGIRLTILAGTQIFASSKVALQIQGELSAEGQELKPIVFTKSGLGSWQGIILKRCERAAISQVQISGARAGIAIIQSDVAILDSIFEGNEIGMHVYSASPQIERCGFFGNTFYGVKEDGQARPLVRNCLFDQNVVGDYYHVLKTIITPEELNQVEGNGGNKAGRDF